MTIMESRLIHLNYALAGLQKTGTALIEFDGKKIIPSMTADDLGIYIWIPKLAYWFSLSLTSAITIFFYGIIIVSLLSALSAFLLLSTNWKSYLVSILSITLLGSFAFFKLYDVYIIYFACPLAMIPWSIYFSKNYMKSNYNFIFMLLSGLVLAAAHYIRYYSSLSTLIFLVSCIIIRTQSFGKKLLLLSLLGAGFLIPTIYVKLTYRDYQNKIATYIPDYQEGLQNHVFWHSLYVGFGFLNFMNKDNIIYDDKYAGDKVLSVNPEVTISDDRYEQILKHEVINLFKTQRTFVIFTLFAKLGILFYYFLLFGSIGLFITIFVRKPWWVDLSFAGALATSMIFPLIAIPLLHYAANFCTLALLWSVISLIFFTNKLKSLFFNQFYTHKPSDTIPTEN